VTKPVKEMSPMVAAATRLDVDDDPDSESDDARPATGATVTLLQSMRAIDLACFPRDQGGTASVEALLNSRKLRRAVRIAVSYDVENRGTSRSAELDPEGKTVAAFATFTLGSMTCEITKVACAVEKRRRGHARKVLLSVLASARERNCSLARLRVETANVAAVALYESLGFKKDRRRSAQFESYYGPGRNAAVYECALKE